MTFWRMAICSDTLHWLDITSTCNPVTELDLITEFEFYRIARDSHRLFATDVACQQRTLTDKDFWSYPTLRLECVLLLIPISHKLAMFDCLSSLGTFIYILQKSKCQCINAFFFGIFLFGPWGDWLKVKIANFPLPYWWMNSSIYRGKQLRKEWSWDCKFDKYLV